MTYERFKAACEEGFEIIRQSITPRDTGNLAQVALRYQWKGKTFHMWVDEDIAPYMVYTNEVWESPRWKGRNNPNEGWWEEAYKFLAYWIAYRTSGELR